MCGGVTSVSDSVSDGSIITQSVVVENDRICIIYINFHLLVSDGRESRMAARANSSNVFF
jgi:hypothetical protein